MSVDITLQAEQQAIADSILDDSNIVGSWKDGPIAEHAGPGEESPAPESLDYRTIPPGGGGLLADLNTDRTDWQSEQREAQREQSPERAEGQRVEQPAQTPETIHEGIQALDSFVQQHELNDPVLAKSFASDFMGAFGHDIYSGGVNVERLGNVMAKVGLSAVNAYNTSQGDPSRLGPIPRESAQAFTSQFLQAFGADPRAIPVDSQYLAETVFRGAMNFLDTYYRFGGKVNDLTQLNDPAQAETFLRNFLLAFGVQEPVDRQTALRFADAAGKYLLGFVGKLQQIQPARTQPRQARSGGRRPSRQPAFGGYRAKPGTSSRFSTNQDIFDDLTMSMYEREHGQL